MTCTLPRRIKYYIFTTLLLCQVLLNAQWVQQGPKLYGTNAVGAVAQGQASAISADGNTVVSGCYGNEGDKGGFFVFRNAAGMWTQQAFIVPVNSEYVGGSVAISADGNTIAVTGDTADIYQSPKFFIYSYINNVWVLQFAPYSQGGYLALSYDGNTLLAGPNVWVRSGSSWSMQATLQPNDASFGSTFGQSDPISVSADGNTAIIGQYEPIDHADMVWVFVRNGNSWSQQCPKLQGTGDTLASGYFIYFITLSPDGNTLAFNSDEIADIWIFHRSGNTWTQDSTVLMDGANSMALSYDGSELLVGRTMDSDNFDYYTYSNTIWTKSGNAVVSGPGIYSNRYYCVISMDSSGRNVLFSDASAFDAMGADWVFEKTGNAFTQYNRLIGQGATGSSYQGAAVAMSGDGRIAAIGGPGDLGYEGAVWNYMHSDTGWTQMQAKININDSVWSPKNFGTSIALSANGSVMAVGAPNDLYKYGNVYIYNFINDQYLLAESLGINTVSNFGRNVALSADGNTLLAGTLQNGAYVFIRNAGVWTQQALLDSGTALLGYPMALSADGNTAVIGNQNSDYQKGSFYVYTRTGSTWAMKVADQRPGGLYQGNYFPSAVAISADGSVIALGCTNAQSDGNVYLFNSNGSTWIQTDSLITGQSDYSEHGRLLAMSATSDTIIERVYASGQINVLPFVKNGAGYVQQQLVPSSTDDAYLDISALAGSADLRTIIVGFKTDSLADGSAVVYVSGSLYDTLVGLTDASCPQSANGQIKISVTGGTAPYTIQWSNGVSGVDSIFHLSPGTYRVSISDAGGDSIVRTFTVNTLSNLAANEPVVNLPCSGVGGSIILNVSSNYPPITYVWNTVPVQTSDTAINLIGGTYVATVSDSLGCTITDTIILLANSYWVDVTSTQPNCGNNGFATATLYGGAGPFKYIWGNGDTVATADSLGAGIYYVTVTDANNCSVSGSAQLNTYCNNVIQGRVFYDYNNNCIQDSGENTAIYYNMSASNGTYTAYGVTDAAGDYQILVPGSGNFSVQIAAWQECDYKVCSAGNYPMQVSFTGSGDTANNINFPLLDSRIDLALFAQDPGGDPGFNTNVTIYYGNLQDSILAGAVTVQFDSTLILNATDPPYSSYNIVTHTASWDIPAIGRLYVSGNSFGGQTIDMNFTISSSIVPGSLLPVLRASITPTQSDCNTANNFITLPIFILSSIDPNGKTAWPADTIYPDDSVITYTIHFQNTGTDSTHFIVISDTLGANVQPGSVRTIASSFYPYTFNVSQNGILTWRFDPLALPDSGTNQQGSQGSITYQVTTQPSLPIGTIINNSAAIYFDYNSGIYTNTAQNVVTARPLGIENVKPGNSAVTVYPNPFSDYTIFKIENGGLPYSVLITDLPGRKVALAENVSDNIYRFHKGALAAGCYLYRVTSGGKMIGCGKLVAE